MYSSAASPGTRGAARGGTPFNTGPMVPELTPVAVWQATQPAATKTARPRPSGVDSSTGGNNDTGVGTCPNAYGSKFIMKAATARIWSSRSGPPNFSDQVIMAGFPLPT